MPSARRRSSTETNAVTRRFDAVSPGRAPGAAQLGERQRRKSTGSSGPDGPGRAAGAGASARTAPASGRP